MPANGCESEQKVTEALPKVELKKNDSWEEVILPLNYFVFIAVTLKPMAKSTL